MQRILLVSFLIVMLASSVAFAEEAKEVKWSSSGGLGYTQTSGNTDTMTTNGKWDMKRDGVRTDMTLKAGGNYGYTKYTTRKNVSANNYFGLYKIDTYFTQAKKSYCFIQPQFQSDEFQGYWGKYMLDAGLGYNWLSSDDSTLKTEAGYSLIDWNYLQPNDDGDRWEVTHNAVARLIFSHKINEWAKVGQEAVYSVNVDDTEDYQAESVTTASFNITSRLSYQVSFTAKYNNNRIYIADKDEFGSDVVDIFGDKVLEKAEYTEFVWANTLVITFF